MRSEANARRKHLDKSEIGKKDWSVRTIRMNNMSGPAHHEFRFPTADSGTATFECPASLLRSPKKFLDALSDYLPAFPKSIGRHDSDRLVFIQTLVDSQKITELQPGGTGFLDLTHFATHSEIHHPTGKSVPIPNPLSDNSSDAEVVDRRGSLKATQDELLGLGLTSSYLSFACGCALAASLPTYLNLRGAHDGTLDGLIPETATFNFSGESSSGKTSIALAALSLIGSPKRAGTLNFTARGLAEAAKDSNDLLLVLDDLEKSEPADRVRSLKAMIHTVSGGRSKTISKGVDRFPALRWSTICLSSSPEPIAVVASKYKWTMTKGDRVRIFDIPVPSARRGGVFDRQDCSNRKKAERSIELIENLQRAYLNNHGQIIPLWVAYLMKGDRTKRVSQLVHRFVTKVDADSDGWEQRFARKFGLVYAAMRMAVEAGLFPWPDSLPLKVAKKCYREARGAVKTKEELVNDALKKLKCELAQPENVVKTNGRPSGAAPICLDPECMAVGYKKDGRSKWGVFEDTLASLIRSKQIRALVTRRLLDEGIIPKGHGGAATIQVHMPLVRDGRTIAKPRVLEIDRKLLSSLVKGLD